MTGSIITCISSDVTVSSEHHASHNGPLFRASQSIYNLVFRNVRNPSDRGLPALASMYAGVTKTILGTALSKGAQDEVSLLWAVMIHVDRCLLNSGAGWTQR